jgi:hypothetical protein
MSLARWFTGIFMVLIALAAPASPLSAQPVRQPAGPQFPTDNPTIQALWEEGMERSQVYPLGQTLLDSLGPRLTGTPGYERAADWLIHMYDQWGVEAEKQQYGTWRGWERGVTHLDLLEPRVRSLESMMLAWSPPSAGTVEGPAVLLPEFPTPESVDAFMATVRGKFVLWSFAEPTCRPDDHFQEFAVEGAFQRFREARDEARGAWQDRFLSARLSPAEMASRMEEAGAHGVIMTQWSQGWGVNKVFGAQTTRIPQINVSCEDYGLIFRLAENGQSPVLRLNAESRFLGDVPANNVIARIPGTELPDEYVMLSAHFDSWDGGSGATDNGTGTLTMMEALRILKAVHPNPRRTILVGHWSGEEQGLNGSRAFVADNPEVVEGLQALFNQDNGTGRVVNISMSGFTRAGEFFARWLTEIPQEITRHINLQIPGMPGSGGTDHVAFVCVPAPGFNLSGLNWEYGRYTWHTNRDTFDKVMVDEVQNNATLVAMLAYLASEDPEFMPRETRALPVNAQTGQPGSWPACRDGARGSN